MFVTMTSRGANRADRRFIGHVGVGRRQARLAVCIATPMQVLEADGGRARCRDRHGVEAIIDLSLVGPVAGGEWLLTFLGSARERIDAQRAQSIDRALSALEAALNGDVGAIDEAFSDLVGREPPLPELLREPS